MAVNLECIDKEQGKTLDLLEFKVRTARARNEYLIKTKDYRVNIAEARKRYLIGNE